MEIGQTCIVDRFEGDWAVLEWNGTTFNLPRAVLPKEVKEGDVLRFSIEVDRNETESRRRRIKTLEGGLFKE